MSFDDWLKNGLPSFNGGKDRTLARKMVDAVGGPQGFKTIKRTEPDGSVTTVQLKGTMPPQVTSTSTQNGGATYTLMFGYTLITSAEVLASKPVFSTPPARALKRRALIDQEVLLEKHAQHLSCDGVLELWQTKASVGNLEKATALCVRKGTAIAGEVAALMAPMVRGLAPSTVTTGESVWETNYSKGYIFGNNVHGRVNPAGYVTIGPDGYTTPSSTTVYGQSSPTPDSALIEFVGMPEPVTTEEDITSFKVFRKCAIVFSKRRIYDVRNGNHMGINTHLYRAPDGTGYLIKCEVLYNGTPYDKIAVFPYTSIAVSIRVTATPTKPSKTEQTERKVTLWTSHTFTLESSFPNGKYINIFTNFSADGTKVAVTMSRAHDMWFASPTGPYTTYGAYGPANDHRLYDPNGSHWRGAWDPSIGVAGGYANDPARYEVVLAGGLSPTTDVPNPPAISATASLIPDLPPVVNAAITPPLLITYYKNTLIVYRTETTYTGWAQGGYPTGSVVSVRLLRNAVPVDIDIVNSGVHKFYPASNNVLIWTTMSPTNIYNPLVALSRVAIVPIDIDGLDEVPQTVNANGVIPLGITEGVAERAVNNYVEWVSWNPVTNEILTSNSVTTDENWV